MLESALILSFSLLLDQLIGEPRRFHPLVGFGKCVNWVESVMNQGNFLRIKGVLALLIAVLPLVVLALLSLLYIDLEWEIIWLLEIVVLYLAIGRKSLMQHAAAVMKPLQINDIETARKKLSYIVSRDTENLQQQGVVTATIESVVENSNDAIFSAVFWYMVAGVPGVLCYRLVNTLDAMWGYKNKRFIEFGWAAAKLDDVMNWIPARLTVLTFAIIGLIKNRGEFKKVFNTAFEQGALCSSPNAGPVMAAGACSLNVKLGGDAIYHGQLIAKPELGYGETPQVKNIQQAMTLVNKSVVLWLFAIAILSIVFEVA
jgi:adenosylcobinamide-phosphate synthase